MVNRSQETEGYVTLKQLLYSRTPTCMHTFASASLTPTQKKNATMMRTTLKPRLALSQIPRSTLRTTPLAISAPSVLILRRSYATRYGDDGGYTNWGGSGGLGSSRKSLPMNTVVKFVPQQEAWIVERMGRFHRTLEPGLQILMPFLDRVRYVKSLKEVAIEIPSQSAITQDNVTLDLDGVLYFRVVDPYKASYGVEDAEFSVAQLAQTTMRAEIGQMTLDRTLAERAHLNSNIVEAINTAAADWGIQCLRYEIRDIHPPAKVVESMHQQVSAERTKRAQILDSEGSRQAAINVAEGHKQSTILQSEADKSEQINRAAGEAEAILLRAQATAEGIRRIADAITNTPGGHHAVSLTVADKYVDAFAQLAKETNTLILPATANDAAGMVAQALTIYDGISKKRGMTTTESITSVPSSSNQ